MRQVAFNRVTVTNELKKRFDFSRSFLQPIITVRNSSCPEVMFLQACVKNSVHMGRSTPLGRHPQTDTPLGRHPLGRHPPGQTPPGQTPHPPKMATAADSTHPTGMHSCIKLLRGFQQSQLMS